ncbi:MAG: hypothetical protein KGK03_10975 [Candidatus Omnitrophica bacterium]|nr:hypothetical protein [Candidatus Omnitrophota bacterium]
MKKPFGGEAPFNAQGVFYAMVHSGRGALRLLLASGLAKKRILLPDYLCKIVLEVMHQYKATCDFYHVKPDLTFDWKQIKGKRYDALYVINYFGQKTKIRPALLQGKTLIIDDVFSPLPEFPKGVGAWVIFNSLRKVMPLAEGALVAANFPLRTEEIKSTAGEFATFKYKAKQIKADYLTLQKGHQQAYLNMFAMAEAKLDTDRGIHIPSLMTLGLLPVQYSNLEKEQKIRQSQYQILDKCLNAYKIDLKPDNFSFYVLKVNCRDSLKEYLAKQGIFLPAHWPVVKGLSNLLYDQILSIPLDSRYSDAQIRMVAYAIRRFFNE